MFLTGNDFFYYNETLKLIEKIYIVNDEYIKNITFKNDSSDLIYLNNTKELLRISVTNLAIIHLNAALLKDENIIFDKQLYVLDLEHKIVKLMIQIDSILKN
jgi:hypothetical protein